MGPTASKRWGYLGATAKLCILLPGAALGTFWICIFAIVSIQGWIMDTWHLADENLMFFLSACLLEFWSDARKTIKVVGEVWLLQFSSAKLASPCMWNRWQPGLENLPNHDLWLMDSWQERKDLMQRQWSAGGTDDRLPCRLASSGCRWRTHAVYATQLFMSHDGDRWVSSS